MKKIISVLAVIAVATCLGTAENAFAASSKKAESDNSYAASVEENKESALSYSNRASEKFMKRDIQGAISDMNEAVRISPNNPQLYLNRGYLKHVINDFEGALKDYNEALKINPSFAFAYNNRGVLKVSLSDINGALEDYAKALSINGKYADVYYNRGNLKYMLNDNEGALADYDKAIALNPKDSEAYNNRGVVKKRMNFNVGALSDYSQAIALNPKDSIAYANRGRLKKLYFDNEGAAIDLNQAVALAENQVFIKNVKPLVSNEHYIAAVPVVQGVTENPKLIKIAPEKQLIAENKSSTSLTKLPAPQTLQPAKDNEKIALAGKTQVSINNNTKTSDKNTITAKSTTSQTIKAGVGTVKIAEPPVTTTPVTKTPTTNVKLADSYYIRGLQKCVLRDMRGAQADLDKAIANNSKHAEAYFYRAAIKKELGDIDGFRKDYAMAIQINPGLQQFNDSNALGLVHS